MKKDLLVNKYQDWAKVAQIIFEKIQGNEIIFLQGDLGSGKTTLVKFLGAKLGVRENIVSPTFNIVNEYQSNKGIIYHLDAFRLENALDLEAFDEYIYNNNITIIEWPKMLKIKDPSLVVKIVVLQNQRKVSLEWF